MKGEKLETTDIFIVNRENCAMPDKTKEGIDVWFVALGSDADKVTIQIGEDLKDLLESRHLGKLGNLFEDRVNLSFKFCIRLYGEYAYCYAYLFTDPQGTGHYLWQGVEPKRKRLG
jgi:hypothetical protein